MEAAATPSTDQKVLDFVHEHFNAEYLEALRGNLPHIIIILPKTFSNLNVFRVCEDPLAGTPVRS